MKKFQTNVVEINTHCMANNIFSANITFVSKQMKE